MERHHPDPPPPEDPQRRAALAAAERFRARSLRGFVRRLAAWKGFDPRRGELLDDLSQELYVVALEHSAELAALDPGRQDRCFMQALQRVYYHNELRVRKRETLDVGLLMLAVGDLGESAATPSGAGTHRAGALDELAAAARHLHNGRVNARRTAERLGIKPRLVRKRLVEAAEALGFDDERERFWARRLGEALLGEAAARLLDTGLAHVWQRSARRRHDPVGGAQRVARILTALEVRPLPASIRAVTSRYLRLSVQSFAETAPRQLLADAERLLGEDPRAALWRFEEAAERDDLTAAHAALRDARHRGADPIRTELARARWHQLRGDRSAAVASLRRGLRRAPADPRLRSSWAALHDGRAPEDGGPSATDRPALHGRRRRYASSTSRSNATADRSKRA